MVGVELRPVVRYPTRYTLGWLGPEPGLIAYGTPGVAPSVKVREAEHSTLWRFVPNSVALMGASPISPLSPPDWSVVAVVTCIM